MLALAQAAGGGPEAVIDESVAVVVLAVAGLVLRPQEGVAVGRRSIDASRFIVLAVAESARYGTQQLVHLAIAVVVSSVALLGRGTSIRIANLRLPIQAQFYFVLALPLPARNRADAIIRGAVTVVILQIAHLSCPWVGLRVFRLAVGLIRETVPIVIFVTGVTLLVTVNIALIGIESERAVVQGSGDAVPVHVGVAGIAKAVLVEVCLVVVGGAGTIVQVVRYSVPVLVRVFTVCNAVEVQVSETLVCRAIAVVVQTIAEFLGPGVLERVQRCAIVDIRA